MLIDHIFICSKIQGNEANRLLECGFLEGSSRVHPGQGTRNRKFYFENFYLEILWEADSKELESELIQKTGLRDRVRFEESGFSRFGLGLQNTEESDSIFIGGEYYQPLYFPEGMRFDILTNNECPWLPWTFRGPINGSKSPNQEPINHDNGVRTLTRVKFQVPESAPKSDFLKRFQGHPQIYFENSEKPLLNLEFDDCKQGRNLVIPDLDLMVRY